MWTLPTGWKTYFVAATGIAGSLMDIVIRHVETNGADAFTPVNLPVLVVSLIGATLRHGLTTETRRAANAMIQNINPALKKSPAMQPPPAPSKKEVEMMQDFLKKYPHWPAATPSQGPVIRNPSGGASLE